MLYNLIKPILFAVDAELAHEVSLEMLTQFSCLIPQVKIIKPVHVMGLKFPNAVGLAAGLDKNADYLPGLTKLGFGFIEVGTVTPKQQAGNPKPRLFRLAKHRSIINRMGFNNKGVDYLVRQISGKPRPFILGINIGKNLSTPVESALGDYQTGFEKVYAQADYISINISSPNTPGLRSLQNEDSLNVLLAGLNETRKAMEDKYQYRRPVALKISPDIDDDTIQVIAEQLFKHRIDALIATNTTVSRDVVSSHQLSGEAGGLSGAALKHKSRTILSKFYRILKDDIPIISAGGIDSPEEARHRLESGAKLIQLYSGLIYRGPSLVKNVAKSI
jgi:dihydroorotate dehydrogenase